MNLYRLGALPWDETQAIYHALAQTGQEGLVICRPASRCLCLGLHDDLAQEVDVAYCRKNDIPLIRRDIGGGMVLLDTGQIFFQLVIDKANPLFLGSREKFFARFLEPAVKTLADFNIQASIRPPADIIVSDKKISGNGAGDINGFAVYTGNILLTFDRNTMASVLNVPCNRFRELTRVSMERYLTTMQEELGYLPSFATIEERLIANFATWLYPLQPVDCSPEIKMAVQKTVSHLVSPQFLGLSGKRSSIRHIKINEGTYIRLHAIPRDCGQDIACGEDYVQKPELICAGYVIILLQDGIIREFESRAVPCLEQDGIAPLAPYLIGTPWREPDVRTALARWRRDNDRHIISITDVMLANWILSGQKKSGGGS